MVASVFPLRTTDQIIYTHRGYGHLLAKGVSILEIVLDTFMKAGGTNYGLGGNMHVTRPDLGIPGREGVFGTRFGIAAGIALAAQLNNSDQVTLCFYGEAAGARGILYESLNMAVLWKLPVVFIAENNGWSFSSKTKWLFPQSRMSRVWRGFDIPVVEFDGNDVEATYSAVSQAINLAREGNGPSVIEGITYRVDPHIWYDDAHYQSNDEISLWESRDPIEIARQKLIERSVDPATLDQIVDLAFNQVCDAFEIAENSPEATWNDSKLAVI